jgi:hypothetical protein
LQLRRPERPVGLGRGHAPGQAEERQDRSRGLPPEPPKAIRASERLCAAAAQEADRLRIDVRKFDEYVRRARQLRRRARVTWLRALNAQAVRASRGRRGRRHGGDHERNGGESVPHPRSLAA